MSIRDAILRAADHIERNPQEFAFNNTRIPRSTGCGTPGCALGWIGVFLADDVLVSARAKVGVTHNFDGIGVVSAAMFDAAIGMDCEFYDRMDSLPGAKAWIRNADSCARALRLYADKYHPAPMQYPDWQAMSAARTIGAHEQDQFARVTP